MLLRLPAWAAWRQPSKHRLCHPAKIAKGCCLRHGSSDLVLAVDIVLVCSVAVAAAVVVAAAAAAAAAAALAVAVAVAVVVAVLVVAVAVVVVVAVDAAVVAGAGRESIATEAAHPPMKLIPKSHDLSVHARSRAPSQTQINPKAKIYQVGLWDILHVPL